MSDSDSRDRPITSTDRRRGAERRTLADRRSGAERRVQRAAVKQDQRAAQRRKGERRSGPDRRSDAGWEAVALDTPAPRTDPVAGLVAAAAAARLRAQARYSSFRVGAALEAEDGQVIGGCNVENATYGLTLCAERVALVKALSEGILSFTRIAIVADTLALTPPCGSCRQLLWEYCGDIEVIVANLDGGQARHRLSALLPLPFDARLLE